MSRFAHDNQVFFEFHHNLCFVKIRSTRTFYCKGHWLMAYIVSMLPVITSNQFLPSHLQTLLFSSYVNHFSVQNSFSSSITSMNSVVGLQHNKLGHPSAKIVQQVLSPYNISSYGNKVSYFYSACCLGKLYKFLFSNSDTVYTQPLTLLHFDLQGPSPTLSASGYNYYIHFIDSYLCYTWIFLLRHNSDVFQTFLNLKLRLNFNLVLKLVHSNRLWR